MDKKRVCAVEQKGKGQGSMIIDRKDAQEIADGLNMILSEAEAYGESVELGDDGMYVEQGTEEEQKRARQLNNLIGDARAFEVPLEWNGEEWEIGE